MVHNPSSEFLVWPEPPFRGMCPEDIIIRFLNYSTSVDSYWLWRSSSSTLSSPPMWSSWLYLKGWTGPLYRGSSFNSLATVIFLFGSWSILCNDDMDHGPTLPTGFTWQNGPTLSFLQFNWFDSHFILQITSELFFLVISRVSLATNKTKVKIIEFNSQSYDWAFHLLYLSADKFSRKKMPIFLCNSFQVFFLLQAFSFLFFFIFFLHIWTLRFEHLPVGRKTVHRKISGCCQFY